MINRQENSTSRRSSRIAAQNAVERINRICSNEDDEDSSYEELCSLEEVEEPVVDLKDISSASDNESEATSLENVYKINNVSSSKFVKILK